MQSWVIYLAVVVLILLVSGVLAYLVLPYFLFVGMVAIVVWAGIFSRILQDNTQDNEQEG